MIKRVLIVSDSHGKNEDIKCAIEQVEKIAPIDMLIHLGDIEQNPDYIRGLVTCPVHMVSGNNDYNLQLPGDKLVEYEGFRFYLTHGHRFYVHGGTERLAEFAAVNKIDVAMFGHTHRPYLERRDGLVLANPGSISYPRQEGRKKTFLMMEIDDNRNLHFNHVELRSPAKKGFRDYF